MHGNRSGDHVANSASRDERILLWITVQRARGPKVTGICSIDPVGNTAPLGRSAEKYGLDRLRDLNLELLAESVCCSLQGE